MNFIWLSANKLGYELLKEAINLTDFKITALITLSDKTTTVMYDSIKKENWYKLGIKVYEIERIYNEKELLFKLNPDFIIMCGWRQIINKEILEVPKKGFIGFHPTLLPKGRGPAPIINSIIKGYKKSGITMYYVSEGLDTGDIIGQEHFEILKNDHANDVYQKIIIAGRKLIRKFLPLLIEGKAPRIPQDETKATKFEKRTLDQNEIDLEKESLEDIYNKIRALSKPYKGAFFKKDGKKLVIWRAELEK